MKKVLSALVLAAMLISTIVLAASATGTATLPIDITDQAKCSTVYEIYSQKLPVVRLDAVFVGANEYDVALAGKAPGKNNGTNRMVTITDWNLPYFFNDPFNWGDGVFNYDTSLWANVVDAANPDDRAPLTYYFDIKDAGKYEFVVVGCAEITETECNDDTKDRGFTYSIDDGQKYQVNISDTKGAFRSATHGTYSFTYTMAEAAADIVTTNGVNSDKAYQVAYYYNLTADLSAGKHTFVLSDLYFSGDTRILGNEGRLNYMGFYYQKAVTEAAWIAYTYPEVTTTEAPATTKAPDTTKAPVTTKAPTTTAAPVTTATASVTTKTPAAVTTAGDSDKGGCGSLVGIGVIAFIVPAAAIIIKKKKD